MNTARQQYIEVLADLKMLILQEHSSGDWLHTDSATYSYFKQKALQKKPAVNSTNPPANPILPKVSASPSIPKQQTPIPTKNIEPIVPPVAPVKAEKIPSPVITTASPPKPEEIPSKKKTLTLEPLSPPTSQDFTEMHSFFKEKFPMLAIVETIPSDQKAKEISQRWKTATTNPVAIILSFEETDKEKSFLENLANAINQHLSPACVISAVNIEQEKSWNKLLSGQVKLVIANSNSLYSLPELMKYYREEPKTGKYFLGSIQLILLSDISLYMKEPQLKVPLWKTLCAILSNK